MGAWRVAMALFGAVLYVAVVVLLAREVHPFVPERRRYNAIGRLPYLVAGAFEAVAGLLDPLGLPLLFLSTLPAAFGGASGLLWADTVMPRHPPATTLTVRRSPAWWAAAGVLGVAYIAVFGPGIALG